jgi:hypothetical protein
LGAVDAEPYRYAISTGARSARDGESVHPRGTRPLSGLW